MCNWCGLTAAGWCWWQEGSHHYLRVPDESIYEAIVGLYRHDPICDRQAQALQPTADPTPSAQPPAWLADETVRLERLEQQLGLRAS